MLLLHHSSQPGVGLDGIAPIVALFGHISEQVEDRLSIISFAQMEVQAAEKCLRFLEQTFVDQ